MFTRRIYKQPPSSASKEELDRQKNPLKTYVLVETPSGHSYRDDYKSKNDGNNGKVNTTMATSTPSTYVGETPSTMGSFFSPGTDPLSLSASLASPATPYSHNSSSTGVEVTDLKHFPVQDELKRKLAKQQAKIDMATPKPPSSKTTEKKTMESPPRTTSTARMMAFAAGIMKKAKTPSPKKPKLERDVSTPNSYGYDEEDDDYYVGNDYPAEDHDDEEDSEDDDNGPVLGAKKRTPPPKDNNMDAHMSTARMLTMAARMKKKVPSSKTPSPTTTSSSQPEPVQDKSSSSNNTLDVETIIPPTDLSNSEVGPTISACLNNVKKERRNNYKSTTKKSVSYEDENNVEVPPPPSVSVQDDGVVDTPQASSTGLGIIQQAIMGNAEEPDVLDRVFQTMEYAFCSDNAPLKLEYGEEEPEPPVPPPPADLPPADDLNRESSSVSMGPGYILPVKMMLTKSPSPPDSYRKALVDDAESVISEDSEVPFDCREDDMGRRRRPKAKSAPTEIERRSRDLRPELLGRRSDPMMHFAHSRASIEVVQDVALQDDDYNEPTKRTTPLKRAYAVVRSTLRGGRDSSYKKEEKEVSADDILNDLAATRDSIPEDAGIMPSKTNSTEGLSFDVEAGHQVSVKGGPNNRKSSPATISSEEEGETVGRQLFPEDNNTGEFIVRVPDSKQQKKQAEEQPAQRKKMSCMMCTFYLSVAACLVAIVVFASMLLIQKSKENSANASLAQEDQDTTNSSKPFDFTNTTEENDVSVPEGSDPSFPGWVAPGGGSGQDAPDFIFVENSEVCASAVALEGINLVYRGTTADATWDDTIDVCGDNMAIGYAQWYTFTSPRDILIEASTCGNTLFDTQITILSGDCSRFTCEAYNDQSCGDRSRATWFAEQGKVYYVLVHGYREANGEYDLLLSPVEKHDKCIDAQGPLLIGSTNFGTTAGSTEAESPRCGGIDTSKPGVWYTVDEDTEGWVRAAVLGRDPNFSAQVAIYTGEGCGDLRCVGGSKDGTVSWRADDEFQYYVFVSGTTAETGGFDLYLGNEQWQDTCDNAVEVLVSDFSYASSTTQARPHNVQSCGGTGKHTAPGLWFKVIGNGKILKADTCLDGTDLDTEISIFQGNCGVLQCVAGSGQIPSCSEEGAVSWLSEFGVEYLVFISGHGSRTGDFTMKIKEDDRGPGSICMSPLNLASSSFVFGSTEGGLAMPACGGIGNSKGVWYEFEGTGNRVNASVCDPATNFDARISLFTGSCVDLECNAISTASCGDNSYIEWLSIVDTSYFLFVHGANATSAGDFRLQLADSTLNDSCETAVMLGSESHSYAGSSINAQELETPSCDKPKHTMRGIWYTLIGTGSEVTISTCSGETNFDTEITILEGDDCDDLFCIDTSEDRDGCGNQAAITFRAREGRPYFVHVHGVDEDEVGNFNMRVTYRDSPFP